MPAKMIEFSAGHHIGNVFFECMKKRPDAICQIDAATGETETNGSVLRRSIELAQSIRKFGIVPGDILALGGKNHLDIHLPHYAGVMNGLPVVGVDPLFKYDEILALFKLTKPKIAFCDLEQYGYFVEAANNLGLDTKIIKFGAGPNSMPEFLQTYRDEAPGESFEPAIFDQDKIYAWLVSSGGTTGVIKVAAIKHQVILNKLNIIIKIFAPQHINNIDGADQTPNKVGLNLSPVQWISGFFHAVSMPMLYQTKLQTSAPPTAEHIIDVINKYKPVTTMMGPSLVTMMLKSEKACDWSCFQNIVLAGGKIYTDLLLELKKKLSKEALIVEAYGQTENLGPVLLPNPFGPLGNCGRPTPMAQIKSFRLKNQTGEPILMEFLTADSWSHRFATPMGLQLVDPETGIEITEPNIAGEMWTKSEVVFSEYYNNPEETASAFTEDGWYKTGDLLYRDKEDNYFFVERIKMLIKYRNYHIIPPELEEIIRLHPGVLEVSVTSIPHLEDGEHTVACVVRQPGVQVTEDDICQLVAEKLSESKQLRGGVIFMDQLPMTSAGKVARGKLKKIACEILKK